MSPRTGLRPCDLPTQGGRAEQRTGPAGSERGVPLPAQAAQSTKATGDLLRRFKELGANMKSHPPPTAAEQELMVR